MSVPIRKRVKRSLRSALVRAVLRLLAYVPLRAALALGTVVGRIGWVLARETRRQMLEQLAIAFPEKTAAEREALARVSFLHFAWLAAEVASLPSYRGRLAEYVGFAPGVEEALRRALGQGRGLVYVTGHVGNWELMAQRVGMLDVRPATIAKATGDARLNALIARMRSDGGVETLWREDPATARAMIRCFKQNRLLGILIDQDTNVQGVFVPFFGRAAYTPRAAADLALRFRAPVMVGTCRRRGWRPGDGHEIAAVEVSYDPEPLDRETEAIRLTSACTAALERAIRQNPAEWVWMHARWKTPPAGDPRESTQAKPMPKSSELSNG